MARRTYVLSQDYADCKHENGWKKLSDLGTLAQNQAKYPLAWRYASEVLLPPGGADSWFQALKVVSAAAIDGVWQGHGAGFSAGIPCTSFNKIVLPAGQFGVPAPVPLGYGGVIGQGVNSATNNGNDTTHLVYDHAGWIDPDPIRAIVRSVNSKNTGVTYLEGATLDMVRLDGQASGWRNSSYTQHGFYVKGMGEGTTIGRVYAHDNNNHGGYILGAGPGRVLDLSSFDNNQAGLRVEGVNSLGGIDIGRLSTDNNGYSFQGIACGAVSLRHLKCETGLSNQRGKPFKAQAPILLSGWSDINVDILTFATSGVVDAVVHIDNTVNNGKIEIRSLRGAGYQNLVIDHRLGKRFYMGGHYSDIGVVGRFSGTSSNVSAHDPATTSTTMVAVPSLPISSNKDRLGIVTSAAQYDYMGWLPKWDDTGGQAPPVDPPPQTCSWVLGTPGAWGACVNGQETRTTPYVSSVAGCTPADPKPADVVETRACTTNPPPTGGAVHTLNNVVVTSPTDSRPVTAFTFKRVVMTDVTFTDAPNYQSLCVQAGGGNKGVIALPVGRFRSPVANEMATQTPATVAAGVKYAKVELSFTQPITTDRLFAYSGAGSALRMTAARVEFLP